MREADTSRAIKYFVLGPLQVRDSHGEVVPVNAEKPRLLLTELLLRRNSWVETDVLIEALWKNPPASVRGNLKTYVHQLRQLLTNDGEDSPIASRRGSYQLTISRGELDSDAFEDLIARGRAALDRGDYSAAEQAQRQALDLWRGDPDRDIAGPAAAIEAVRLHELRWAARDALADALIGQGRAADAVAALRALTVEDSLREATWERLVTALRDAGRPADALAAYQKIRSNLITEFGAEPGSALRELHAELLAATEDAPTPTPTRSAVAADPVQANPAPTQWFRKRPIAVSATAIASVLTLVLVGAVVFVNRSPNRESPGDVAANMRLGAIAPQRPVPGFPSSEQPKLLFGLGDEATTAAHQPLADQAPIGMLTTWYDGEQELAQYKSWSRELIPEYYAAGKALHLILVPTWDHPTPVDTKYGPGCGKAYPLSPEFLDHMRELATYFAGKADDPPLYVSVFNGLEKVSCTDDAGYRVDPPTTNYYRALKDRYLEVRQVFHQNAPNARVALNWDGWQANGDDPELGSRRSLIEYFSDVLAVSDFQSFSGFEEDGNAAEVERMVAELGQYGPVMMSYFGPYRDFTGETLRSDLNSVFAPERIKKLTSQGLFAWGFRSHKYVDVSPEAYSLTKEVVNRYGQR